MFSFKFGKKSTTDALRRKPDTNAIIRDDLIRLKGIRDNDGTIPQPQKVLLNRKIKILEETVKPNYPFFKKTVLPPLTDYEEQQIKDIVDTHRPHTLFDNFKTPQSRRVVETHYSMPLNLPDVPRDDTSIPKAPKLKSEPYNHLLIFYVLFIFRFLETYHKLTGNLCMLVNKEAKLRISINLPLFDTKSKEKEYNSLKENYNKKVYTFPSKLIPFIELIPSLLEQIPSVLIKDVIGQIFFTETDNQITIHRDNIEKMKNRYRDRNNLYLQKFKNENDEYYLSNSLIGTLDSLYEHVKTVYSTFYTIVYTVIKYNGSILTDEAIQKFNKILLDFDVAKTRLKKDIEKYEELVFFANRDNTIDVGILHTKMTDITFGGRRKSPKKPTNLSVGSRNKSKHADMNMKDIKRLCKANQIKLSKTKDGIRVIYTKKELITKLKRKKIL